MNASSEGPRQLSIILPVYNEAACIERTLRELIETLSGCDRPWEIVAVDDGSGDETPVILDRMAAEVSGLRIVRLRRNAGQSAAMSVGFRAAAGDVLVTMDADGQNDPADIPRLLEALSSCDCCCGYRRERRDSWSKRWGSRLANRIRNRVLREDIIDTGCTLKAFKAELVEGLWAWNGMHRFLPSLFAMRGARIRQIPVHHRPRAAGVSKYTNLGRLKTTLADLLAVRWMRKRNVVPEVEA